MKLGIGVVEFWEMTPVETHAALDAAAWRMELEAEQMVSSAWHIANLSRARTLPRLAELLRRMRPSEEAKRPIEERRKEFEELKAKHDRGDPRRGPDPNPGQAGQTR